jgi:hypothetical protein
MLRKIRYIVTLTEEQNRTALDGGRYRMRYDMHFGMRREEDTARATRTYQDQESDNMLGAKGEQAYGAWQGHPWRWNFPPLVKRDQTKAPDFSGDRDVKTIYLGGHHLLLQKSDPADRIYILARSSIESLDVQFLGWCMGEEGKLADNWKEGKESRPCFWTHEKDLHDMQDCPNIKLPGDQRATSFELPTRALPSELAPGAKCGSFACGGCYSIGDGRFIHPPRAGYRQADLLKLDEK